MNKRRHVVTAGVTLAVAILAAVALVPRCHRAYAKAKEHACANNLCILQSAICSAAMANAWDENHCVSAAELKQFFWDEHPYPSCPTGGDYILPETLKTARPTCSAHGNLLEKYNVPDELTRRTTHWNLDDAFDD